MILTALQYHKETHRLAEYFASGDWKEDYSEDAYLGDVMHEILDGHEFIIYYHKAKAVMMHTDNEDAYFDVCGDDLPFDSFGSMCCAFAYWAMLADVQHAMSFVSD